MKFAHLVRITVFSKKEDNEEQIKDKLISLVPFDLKDEKIKVEQQTATGFEENKIIIFTITLSKNKHINLFLNNLKSKLTQDQKEMLLRQAESRLDEELHFFLRLDKEKLLKEDKFWITDSGNCFHIKISIAAFPAKKGVGLKLVAELFDS